jgi:hypothetical protein
MIAVRLSVFRASVRSEGNKGNCVEVAPTAFRKSSRSHGTKGDCVEVSPAELTAPLTVEARAVRDSKAPAAHTVGLPLAAWSAFTAVL